MSIGSGAFVECKSLTSVVIGKSVTGIGKCAFERCPNLTSVTSYVEVPFELEERAFFGCYTAATLYVPAASLGLYKTTKYWTLFQDIQPIATLSAVTLTARSYTREYGEANPVFEYDAVGGALSGEPVVTCTADETSPVGDYPIVIEQGTVENELTLVNGTLTITKAPLT